MQIEYVYGHFGKKKKHVIDNSLGVFQIKRPNLTAFEMWAETTTIEIQIRFNLLRS